MVMDMQEDPPLGHEVPFKATGLSDRVQELMNLGVSAIVCGALSEIFYSLLRGKGFHLICGIAGDLDAVVAAYQEGSLARACFRMPGATPRKQSET
jgi:predicted Fe-Mo cluster-binding NifX family protein